MPIMRYKLIGTNMVERPTKGEWVRWDDMKNWIEPGDKVEEGYNDEAISDNKRSRK